MALSTAWVSAIEGYRREQRAAGLRPDTLRARSEHLQHLARRLDVEPWDVTSDHLLDYVDARTWMLATRRSRRSTLRGFYTWAVSAGHVASNPALALPRVKPSVPTPRPIPTDVYEAAYGRADARERLMMRLARDAGLRRGEVARVHSRDLFEDLTGWSLHVDGKGGKARDVHLAPRLAFELRALPAGWAFPGELEGHLSPRWVGKLVNRLLPKPWTIHTIRHRNAKEVHRAMGRDLVATAKHLGHASTVTTQVYVPVDDEHYERGVDAAAS
jgi:integrase/recombinase XerC